ncbi:MAG: epimerase [Actinomycetia bacterium]|nr:epimerase [Actinomycetes bacterium]
MRVAVTGGSGFIGSHVVDYLCAAGHDVVVVDVRPPHRADVRFERADVLDTEALTRSLRGCDAVFHLAGVANVNDATADPVRAIELNVTGTARVWEAARACGVKRAVLASTVWVYGAAPGEGEVDESTAFDLARAAHVYTSSKLGAELVVQSCHELYGQEFTILRYGIPFGPRMRDELVIARFVKAALAGEPITVHGDGSQWRNYVYVEDMAEAHVRALDPAGANEVFNLEGAEAVTVRRIVELIAELVPRKVDVTYLDARAGDYAGRSVSGERARRLLGWEPTVSFAEGLGRYMDSYLDRRIEAPAIARVWQRRARVAPLAAALAVPALAFHGALDASVVPRSLAVLAAAVTAYALYKWAPRPTSAMGGATAAIASCWLLSQATGGLIFAVAVLFGAGVGVVLAGAPPPEGAPIPPVAAIALAAMVLGIFGHMNLSLWAAGLLVVVTARPSLHVGLRSVFRVRQPNIAFAWVMVTLTLLLIPVVGATSATATWFGTPPVAHGSRQGSNVALTFDTPSADASVAIARALSARGVRGTFFITGNGIRTSSSAATKAILDRHQLVGKNMYDRDPIIMLNPGAGQLANSQRVFRDELGVCPAFFRPSHRYHTPVVTRSAQRRGIVMVGWDVSVGDALEKDPATVARLALSHAQAGSIIRIDVGTDGSGSAAASVVDALPAILHGLRERGLGTVALDQLLHRRAYETRC